MVGEVQVQAQATSQILQGTHSRGLIGGGAWRLTSWDSWDCWGGGLASGGGGTPWGWPGTWMKRSY